MKYAFIRKHRNTWTIAKQCRAFKLSRSGYYVWLKNQTSLKHQEHQELDNKIIDIFNTHKKRYGAPRITKELNIAGLLINHKRVEKRMKSLGLKAKQAKKFKATTDSNHNYPVAENILDQDFSATGPNQKWAGDITYIWTQSGWLYLAVIIDLFSRQVIGWSMSNRINKVLVCDALKMALWKRKFPKNVMVHSDRGSQYCSKQYQTLLKDHQLICSMSGKGCCYDNAVSETFFHTLKVECLNDYYFYNRDEAKTVIFEYIEIYYNHVRMHSSIDYKTPVQFEQLNTEAS